MVGNRKQFGIICKIWFGEESSVYSAHDGKLEDDYRELMKTGKWGESGYNCRESDYWEWGTPSDYMRGGFEGEQRTKLLLYDKYEEGITVDITVIPEKYYYCNDECNEQEEYCFKHRNVFKPEDLRILSRPIPLGRIRHLEGFEDFKVPSRDRSAYRLISEEDYQKLIGGV